MQLLKKHPTAGPLVLRNRLSTRPSRIKAPGDGFAHHVHRFPMQPDFRFNYAKTHPSAVAPNSTQLNQRTLDNDTLRRFLLSELNSSLGQDQSTTNTAIHGDLYQAQPIALSTPRPTRSDTPTPDRSRPSPPTTQLLKKSSFGSNETLCSWAPANSKHQRDGEVCECSQGRKDDRDETDEGGEAKGQSEETIPIHEEEEEEEEEEKEQPAQLSNRFVYPTYAKAVAASPGAKDIAVNKTPIATPITTLISTPITTSRTTRVSPLAGTHTDRVELEPSQAESPDSGAEQRKKGQAEMEQSEMVQTEMVQTESKREDEGSIDIESE